MGDLNIKTVSIESTEGLNAADFDISLKLDGTLIYFKDNKLISPRCERSFRYKHILDILIANKFPDCMGEMFIDKPNANVFDISKKENWAKAKFMPFDLINSSLSYLERKKLLDAKVKELNHSSIFPVKRFKTFKDGWKYVLDNQSEGLVLRNNTQWLKIKLLQEVKIEIIGHEAKKDKGTFLLANGGNISGTAVHFVEQYFEIKKSGNKAIAEIEFPFMTRDGKFFQPRLRQITCEAVK